MMNNKTTSKVTGKTSSKTAKSNYSKTGSVYKTPSGTFRARKNVNGTNFSKNFTRKREALNYLNSLVS